MGQQGRAQSDLVVRNVNEGSADTTGAFSRLVNPSDPIPELKKVHFHFKEKEKRCRTRQILHLVIPGQVTEAKTASCPVLQSHVQTTRLCFHKCWGSRGLHQEDNSNSGCTWIDVTLSELHLLVPALRVAEGQAALG